MEHCKEYLFENLPSQIAYTLSISFEHTLFISKYKYYKVWYLLPYNKMKKQNEVLVYIHIPVTITITYTCTGKCKKKRSDFSYIIGMCSFVSNKCKCIILRVNMTSFDAVIPRCYKKWVG